MAKLYTKNTWLDEILADDEKYLVKNDVGETVYSEASIELSTTVVQAGSPVSAERMNHIEEGIDALDSKLAEFTNENLLLNGDFLIWQDGFSFSLGDGLAYTADNVRMGSDGTGGAKTVSREEHTPGGSDASGNQKYYWRCNQTAVASSGTYNLLSMFLPETRMFAGKEFTLTFSAKAAANETMPGVAYVQNFGSGGSANVGAFIEEELAVGTSWADYSYTFSLPSASSKIFGAGETTFINFYLPVDKTFQIDLSSIKLEYGNLATERRQANFQDELRKCKDYYEKSYSYGVKPGTASATAGIESMVVPSATIVSYQLYGTIRYSSEKRVSPTITVYGYNGTPAAVSDPSTGGDLAANSGSATYGNKNGFTVYNATGSDLSVGRTAIFFHWVSNARF